MAPPHISSDAALRSVCAVAGPAFRMSYVRMRVASRLWWASRLSRGQEIGPQNVSCQTYPQSKRKMSLTAAGMKACLSERQHDADDSHACE